MWGQRLEAKGSLFKVLNAMLWILNLVLHGEALRGKIRSIGLIF
jgi:hypothetical protein